MSMHVVDNEQRRDRRATPMRPSGSGLAGTSAALALLDAVHRHRLRRTALHLPPPGQERGPFYYSDRLLVIQHKGNGHVHLILDNLLAVEAHMLFFHPRAANITKRFYCPSETLVDGVLKAHGRSTADFLDFCYWHGCPPVICLSAESWWERTSRPHQPLPAIRFVRRGGSGPPSPTINPLQERCLCNIAQRYVRY